MVRFDNGTGAKLTVDHTAGAVHTIPAGTRGVWIRADVAAVWIRFGGATLAGTDVVTETESATATDFPIVAGPPGVLVGCPGAAVKIAVRAAADQPGSTVYVIPVSQE
jgi:hypothetical protein